MKGFRLKFGIGARGPECFYDEATRWSKNFKARFSRSATIPAVTDSHPPSQPATQTRCRSKDTAYYVARVKIEVIDYRCIYIEKCSWYHCYVSIELKQFVPTNN